MLNTVTIENYKSIERMKLSLGRVNVLIGENGAGKSNIVEAIALAGAAQANKLDHEFLTSRGIRAVAPRLMRSAFQNETKEEISLTMVGRNKISTKFTLRNDGKPYSAWKKSINSDLTEAGNITAGMQPRIDNLLENIALDGREKFLNELRSALDNVIRDESRNRVEISSSIENIQGFHEFFTKLFPSADDNLSSFVIFSPENSALRQFENESQIEPLGIRGEGLLRLLNVIEAANDTGRIEQIRNGLRMLGWFDDYKIVEDATPRMEITDRFLPEGLTFDQRSANEGFLFIAFYFALFCSEHTPPLFAVDNIDASLNPKLCSAMIEQLVGMAKRNDKQVILTTHNPAVLDGLDLNDDEQRLFVVQRNRHGRTEAIRRKKPAGSDPPRKLSEMFMAGLIGGLPKAF
ncbi:MAG: AAA family ATPase [Pseudomonadota bacterium]